MTIYSVYTVTKFLIENMIIRLITCGAGYINLLGDNKKKRFAAVCLNNANHSLILPTSNI